MDTAPVPPKLSHEQAVSIIRDMRRAIDVLKQKYLEEAGSWATLEFLEAALRGPDGDHWVRTVAAAEALSDPWKEP